MLALDCRCARLAARTQISLEPLGNSLGALRAVDSRNPAALRVGRFCDGLLKHPAPFLLKGGFNVLIS